MDTYKYYYIIIIFASFLQNFEGNKYTCSCKKDCTYPNADDIYSLSVRAFNMVSAVVKVFQTTTTTTKGKKSINTTQHYADHESC